MVSGDPAPLSHTPCSSAKSFITNQPIMISFHFLFNWGNKLKHCNKTGHNIPFSLLITHPPPLPSLIWPQTLCVPGPAQLEPPLCIFYCIWSQVSRPYFMLYLRMGHFSSVFCISYSARSSQHWLLCSEPLLGGTFYAKSSFTQHSPCSR